MYVITRKPKVMEIMTVQAMEMAARLRSLRWPANACVMTVKENIATRLKIEGPAITHSFFDSCHVLFSTFSWCSSFCFGVEARRAFSSSLILLWIIHHGQHHHDLWRISSAQLFWLPFGKNNPCLLRIVISTSSLRPWDPRVTIGTTHLYCLIENYFKVSRDKFPGLL